MFFNLSRSENNVNGSYTSGSPMKQMSTFNNNNNLNNNDNSGNKQPVLNGILKRTRHHPTTFGKDPAAENEVSFKNRNQIVKCFKM